MSKKVQITKQIEEYIRTAVGDNSLDTNNLVVFEARAITTEPILRKGGFFQGARVSPSTLRDMATLLNKPGGAVPMQIMHDTDVLPVGRVFKASVAPMENGHEELRVLFYIPQDKTQIIQDIENAVIDEVSVGLMNEHAFCSECNFDYFGPEADYMNRMTLTCNEDHTIGVDGVHINLVGVDDWAELSLVNRGAAKGAKILSHTKQTMSQNTAERLAASNIPLEQRLLVASYKVEENKFNKPRGLQMDKELLAMLQAKSDEVADHKVKFAQANVDKEALIKTNTELSAALDAAKVEITELKADPAKEELQTQLAAAKKIETEMSEAVAELVPHVKAALVASGEVDTTLPTTFSAMLELVKSKGLKLHQIFGVDPAADANKTDVLKASAEAEEYRKEAFKTNRAK